MRNVITAVLLSLFISACHSGSGSGSGKNNNTDNHVEDGIYANDTDLAVMLVDTELAEAALVVGDYTGESIYFTGAYSINDNILKTKGLRYASASTQFHDTDIEITTEFSQQGATLTTTINSENVVYSFDKAPASASLSDIVGIHANIDKYSTVWTINPDGSFTVIGMCNMSGTMVRVKDYFLAKDVKATSCAATSLDGNYEARILTVNWSGKLYILGAMVNTNGIVWWSAPID